MRAAYYPRIGRDKHVLTELRLRSIERNDRHSLARAFEDLFCLSDAALL
jgi:hypothetical protein